VEISLRSVLSIETWFFKRFVLQTTVQSC